MAVPPLPHSVGAAAEICRHNYGDLSDGGRGRGGLVALHKSIRYCLYKVFMRSE